jgi:GT2 family glycosyltransferase
MRVSVIIPTLERGELLLDTLDALLALQRPPDQIVVVDQTDRHPAAVARRLGQLQARGAVEWVHQTLRSVTAAMNRGAALASGELLLFLDDDVRLDGELIAMHERCQLEDPVALVAGRVLQPWHHDCGPSHPDPDEYPDRAQLHANAGAPVRRFMAGNVCVRRDWFLRTGGFDENFRGVAYRFEADFAERLLSLGGRMRFAPEACLHHLHAERGGTRTFGEHGRTLSPWHSAGRWYYLLRHPRTPGLFVITAEEVLRAVASRRNLRAPWYCAIAAVAELRGLLMALNATIRGPRLGLEQERQKWTC